MVIHINNIKGHYTLFSENGQNIDYYKIFNDQYKNQAKLDTQISYDDYINLYNQRVIDDLKLEDEKEYTLLDLFIIWMEKKYNFKWVDSDDFSNQPYIEIDDLFFL